MRVSVCMRKMQQLFIWPGVASLRVPEMFLLLWLAGISFNHTTVPITSLAAK